MISFVDSTAERSNVLLAGSFNMPPDSPQLDTLQDSYESAFALASPEQQAPPTLNQYVGHPPLTMDYIFVSSDAGMTLLEVSRGLDAPDEEGIWASDRFAVIADFLVEARRRRR